MIAAAILVASAALNGGSIPVWDSVRRFPDSSYWPGSGRQRTANMLEAIREEVGSQLRWAGPGPQQLAARWGAGKLSRDERIVVLLCGADYHDPSLLPVFRVALRSEDLRERQAALIGLHWLLGEPSPDATSVMADAQAWSWIAGFVDELAVALRQRTLVELWADSYLAAAGVPRSEAFVLPRSATACLTAIREVATPDDVNALVALWPLVNTAEGRYSLMSTIEMVTLRKFLEIVKSPRGGWGTSFYDASAARVDAWVGGVCGTLDGGIAVRTKIEDTARADGTTTLAAWLSLAWVKFPPAWPTVAEQLQAFGAPVERFNRWQLDDPTNEDAIRQVRDYFPLSSVRSERGDVQRRPRPVR